MVSISKYQHAVICAVLLFFQVIPVHASTLAITLSDSTPIVGDQVTASLTVSDMVDLYNFNLDLGFDTAVLSVASVQPGTFFSSAGVTLGDVGLFGSDLTIAGQVQDINDGLLGAPTGVSGNGVLATVVFNVHSLGSSTLDWLNLGQTDGTLLLNSAFNPITLDQTHAATVTAGSPVPVPAALWLALSSLVFYPSMKKLTQEQQA